jgi:hypothetical protein
MGSYQSSNRGFNLRAGANTAHDTRKTTAAAPAIIRTYVITATHPPQVLAIGRGGQGKLTAINCSGPVACTVFDFLAHPFISIDSADGVDMQVEIPFRGPLSVSMKTTSSLTFVIEK